MSINTTTLPLMEAFYTIQGEGFYQGSAAYFIRLGGCDVGCHWCDVKDSWDVNAHPQSTIEEIVSKAADNPARIAVITGGEPLMHDISELCNALNEKGFRTHIETSGAYHLRGNCDWLCLSPKKFKEPVEEICQIANELKMIVFNKSDFEFAEKYKKLVSPDCKLYLQPEWDKQSDMLPLMIDYVKQHSEWKICLQIHKYLQIP